MTPCCRRSGSCTRPLSGDILTGSKHLLTSVLIKSVGSARVSRGQPPPSRPHSGTTYTAPAYPCRGRVADCHANCHYGLHMPISASRLSPLSSALLGQSPKPLRPASADGIDLQNTRHDRALDRVLLGANTRSALGARNGALQHRRLARRDRARKRPPPKVNRVITGPVPRSPIVSCTS